MAALACPIFSGCYVPGHETSFGYRRETVVFGRVAAGVGGMRQSGLLAAAATYALEHHVQRLSHDHAMAQRLAAGIRNVPGLAVRSAQTNIVFVDVENGRGPALLHYLKSQGVLATGLIGVRFVTHLHIDEAGVDHAIGCIHRFFEQGLAAPAATSAASAVY